jgi:hypothetical protein
MEAPEHPCAICGVLTRDGLFAPTIENEAYRPGPPAPLCQEHKTEFLRGRMAFPVWCGGCRAWRSADHVHDDKVSSRKKARPQT